MISQSRRVSCGFGLPVTCSAILSLARNPHFTLLSPLSPKVQRHIVGFGALATILVCVAAHARAAETPIADDVTVDTAASTTPAKPASDDTQSETESKPPKDAKDKPVTLKCVSCDALDTRLSGHLKSELYLMQRSRAHILGDGVYAIDTLNVLPFYETMELRADEVYHKGLSVHFQGWAGVDLNEVYFDNRLKRVVGDPTYFYVQFQSGGLNATAGRQMVYTGTARGLHIDGIDASYQLPNHFGIEGLAGLVVSPYLGPNWYREQVAVDFNSFGPGFSDWKREGNYAAGGRLFYRRLGVLSGGISFLHVTELSEMSQQLLGADVSVTPWNWCAAYFDATLDLPTTSIQRIGAELDFYPVDIFSFSIDYGLTDPTLFLSHMSIFSIFASEQYHSVGATARVTPLEWLQVFSGYHYRLYDAGESQTDNGFELSTGLTFKYLKRKDGTILVFYRRLTETDNGLHEFRVRATVPFAIDGVKAVTNAYLDIYDNRVKSKSYSFIGDIGLFYTTGPVTGGGSVSAGTTPYNEDEIRAMVKFAYNFEKSFVEHKKL